MKKNTFRLARTLHIILQRYMLLVSYFGETNIIFSGFMQQHALTGPMYIGLYGAMLSKFHHKPRQSSYLLTKSSILFFKKNTKYIFSGHNSTVL